MTMREWDAGAGAPGRDTGALGRDAGRRGARGGLRRVDERQRVAGEGGGG